MLRTGKRSSGWQIGYARVSALGQLEIGGVELSEVVLPGYFVSLMWRAARYQYLWPS
jgi:hypothetical protein